MTKKQRLEDAIRTITERAGVETPNAFHITSISRDSGGGNSPPAAAGPAFEFQLQPMNKAKLAENLYSRVRLCAVNRHDRYRWWYEAHK